MSGWAIADPLKRKYPVADLIQPGSTTTVQLSGRDIQLGNECGIITLLHQQGIKVDGVSYTKEDTQSQGSTIVF